MKKKAFSVLMTFVLLLSAFNLTACSSSEFGGEVVDEKNMTITAENADKEDSFMVGSLKVDQGEEFVIGSALEKGSITISLILAPEDQNIDELPDLDVEPVITTEVFDNTTQYFAADPGDYYVKAEVTDKATGTINIAVQTAEGSVETQTDDGMTDYGTSEIYTKEDMDSALEMVQQEFTSWKGCEMHAIRYAGDESCTEENLKWMNDLNADGNYTQVAEFLMDFHSPAEQLDGWAWTANAEYMDYEWWLARSADGSWDIVTFGY
jgi:D-alanyl-D-alanine carboxypeptidase